MVLSTANTAEGSEEPRLDRSLDDDLERRVRIYLGARFHPALNRLCVSARGGCVALSGTVNSFYEKQLALSTCRRVAGVRNVVDRMQVVHDTHTSRKTASSLVLAEG